MTERKSGAIYYDQLSVIASMGGLYTSVFGIFYIFYKLVFLPANAVLAYRKYSEINKKDEEDQTSADKDHTQDVKKLMEYTKDRVEPAATDETRLQDFNKNLNYYGSMDHFVQ